MYLLMHICHQILISTLNKRVRFGGVPIKDKALESLKFHYNKHPSLTLFGTVKEMYELKG